MARLWTNRCRSRRNRWKVVLLVTPKTISNRLLGSLISDFVWLVGVLAAKMTFFGALGYKTSLAKLGCENIRSTADSFAGSGSSPAYGERLKRVAVVRSNNTNGCLEYEVRVRLNATSG